MTCARHASLANKSEKDISIFGPEEADKWLQSRHISVDWPEPEEEAVWLRYLESIKSTEASINEEGKGMTIET